jgi:hypothetical protein
MMAEVSITAKGGDLVLSTRTVYGLGFLLAKAEYFWRREKYRLDLNVRTNLSSARWWGWR